MGVGIGGLVTNLMQGDPTQQIANALAGPNPNPQAAAGGAPGPSGAPGQANQQQQQMPPAQAYAPDPANANTIALLLKVHQQDMAANSINQGIDRIGASFGTAQQQHDKLAALNSGGYGQDTLGALGEITKLQGDQFALQQKQIFTASAGMLANKLAGIDPQVGAALSSNPQIFAEVMQHKLSAQDPTEMMKNINAYKDWAKSAGIPPDQVQEAIGMAFTGSLSPGSRDEKDMNLEMQRWAAAHPGQDPHDQPQFKDLAAFKGYNADIGAQASIAGKEKETARSGLPSALATIKPVEDILAQMYGPDGKVKDSVINAIQTPDTAPDGVTGWLAGVAGRHGVLDADTLAQKAKLAQLQNALSASGLQNVKNVRNKSEFLAIGGSLSSVFDKRNPKEQIQAGIDQLRDKYNLAKYNAIAAGGGEIPAEWADKVDKDYLSGGSLDNNATIAKPKSDQGAAGAPETGGKPLSPDDMAQAKANIAKYGREAVLSHLKAKGYDTSGL